MVNALDRIGEWLKNEKFIFGTWMLLVAMTIAYATMSFNPLMAIIPLVILFALWVIKDYTRVFYLFFLLLPFSIEYNFTPSLGTDLPSEPLMWIMLGISILLFCQKWPALKSSRYFNLITLLLMVHLAWYGITTLISENPFLSFKVLLAKIWYIIPFYFMTIHILRNRHDVEKMIKSGVYTLTIAIIIVLYRHYLQDFAFDQANFVVTPIFRNHVNYACIIVIFLPFLWTLFIWAEGRKKQLYVVMMAIYLAGIYFSYTRAAIIAVILAAVVFYIIKWKMIKPVLIVIALFMSIGISYLLYNNQYLRMNPDYERTISHDQFDQLITATYKMEDISTMERVYRWVAGIEMIKDKPVFGFGPGTFYAYYSGYTIAAFQTYVSDNPDHSTVHCYYLLTFIEQGVIGFIIFLALIAIVLVYGERKYHRLKDKKDKAVVMAAMLSFTIILLIILINDMIETDKVGPFFFMTMAIIAAYKEKSIEQAEHE